MLFLGEHGHNNERVEVNSLTQHPEVVTPEQVEMDKLGDFTAGLGVGVKKEKENAANKFNHTAYIQSRSNLNQINIQVQSDSAA